MEYSVTVLLLHDTTFLKKLCYEQNIQITFPEGKEEKKK